MSADVINAFIGGLLIGVSALMMLYFCGRIAGNSGIVAGVFTLPRDRQWWRIAYLVGLILGVKAYAVLYDLPPYELNAPIWTVVVAGILVGYGTRLGGGCTSGHGICGLARFSKRSLVATLIFMLTAIGTVTLIELIRGAGQ